MKRILIVLAVSVLILAGGWVEAASQLPFIKVISPNGGQTLELGSARKIAWKSSGVNSVMLYLTNPEGGVMASNLENVPGNPGYTYWVVSNHIPTGSYKVLIFGCAVASGCTYNQKIVEDISDAPFDIIQPKIPIITQKASWYLPHVINSVVNNMEYFMRDFNGPAEYRILIDGVRTEGRIYLENYNLVGKTLKIYCLDGGELHSSEQQTIDFRAQGANLVVDGCVVKNNYTPDPNHDPATRWDDAAIVAAFGPEEVKITNTDITSTHTNGISLNYVGKETLIHNEIYAARIAVSHSNMGEEFFRPRRVNRDNIIQGGLIAHFFRNTKVYPIPNDNYIYVAVAGATTADSYVPAEIRQQFLGELW